MAVLIGSVIVAVGAYLGLRERSIQEAVPAISGGAATSIPTGATDAPLPQTAQARPQPASVTPEVLETAKAGATKELQKHKKHLIDKCWKPSAGVQPEPTSATYTLDLTFDAEGKQLGRGLTEPRRASRPDVPQCLQRELPNLVIDAPSVPVAFKVELTLP